jgi:hypothetical protein
MVKKRILFVGFLITLLIFITIYFTNIILNKQREDAIDERMTSLIENYEEMQTLSMMSNLFGEEGTCLIMQAQLLNMNKEIWETGRKIDQYRTITEEFMDDPFYLEQKRRFNLNEALYFSLLEQMKKSCEVNQTTLLFFYQKKENCPDCDAQSFVLTDIRHEFDEELAIFSFDADLDLAPVAILAQYYNITKYPCTIVEDTAHCGLYDKDDMMDILCNTSYFSECSDNP